MAVIWKYCVDRNFNLVLNGKQRRDRELGRKLMSVNVGLKEDLQKNYSSR